MSEIKKNILRHVEEGNKLLEKGSMKEIKDHMIVIEATYVNYIPTIKGVSVDMYGNMTLEQWKSKLKRTNKVLLNSTNLVAVDGFGKPIPYEAQLKGKTSITNHNANEANSQNEISVNVDVDITAMFEQVREELDGVLSDESYQELLTKISELEDIQNNTKGRGKKWSKAKGIFDWITTQGVDVGIKLLPIIIKMMEQ